jgi:5-(carboxyamino)imidazole ribonucleotide mutase
MIFLYCSELVLTDKVFPCYTEEVEWNQTCTAQATSRQSRRSSFGLSAERYGIRGAEVLMDKPLVGVIMGSTSDWETMKEACAILDELQVPYEKKVVSARRTPDLMFEYAQSAKSRGLEVIIAGAGGAAHLPGMVAAKTVLPVIGVPVKSANLNGLDSLLSIVQMPGGVPVATVAIGKAGAINAGLLAAQMLGIKYPQIQERFQERRDAVRQKVLEDSELR